MAEADCTVKTIVNLQPVLTNSEMRKVEKHCRGTQHGISRRMLLGILTKTGEELIEAALAAPEAMVWCGCSKSL